MDKVLSNAVILVTGAAGLIGQNLALFIHSIAPSCRVIAVVHSMEKAKAVFPEEPWITLMEADVNKPLHVEEHIDYIIHGAGITSSRRFVEAPADTIMTAVNGTCNALELARQKNVKSFVLLSTMEVYGAPSTDDKITEDTVCNLDPMNIRSSYPESKRLCETMCSAYCAQYSVPAKVIRLAQTIGPGIDYHDGRVFAEFARCVLEKRDIVLHTKGETKRCYLSTEDAASAILTVLLKGENGQAYNAANESTYCSIYEMAELVARECAGGEIGVEVQLEDVGRFGYAPVLRMNLNTEKLRGLGWKAEIDLTRMFTGLIDWMKQHRT